MISDHYPATVSVDLTPKRGTTQRALFGLVLSVPYPSLELDRHNGWRRDDQALFPDRSRGGSNAVAQGLADRMVRAWLLRSDIDDATADGSCRDHAGFVISSGYGKPKNDPNLGALIYRGSTIGGGAGGTGELHAEIHRNRPHMPAAYVSWCASYGNSLTSGQRDYLDAQAAPAILEAIAANRDALMTHAHATLKACIVGRIATARQQVDKAEADALDALDRIDTKTGRVRA